MIHHDLSDLPESMKPLPIHIRMGLPIPLVNTFGWQDYDFTTVNGDAALQLARRKLCGICGGRFEVAAFLGGTRSAENQAYSDPPMHEDCALAAIRLCPHINRQNMRRASDNHTKEGAVVPHGMGLNKPTEWMLFACNEYRIFVDGPKGERSALYVPQDNLYVRTWQYDDQGQLEEI